MNHSLRTADRETHVRIVAISLAAGLCVVVGALNIKFDTRRAGDQSWANGTVIKASRQVDYSSRERSLLR